MLVKLVTYLCRTLKFIKKELPDLGTPYIYVFIRKDIPLADQIVQVGHLGHIAGRTFQHPTTTNLVLLQIESQKDLLDVGRYLRKTRIKYITHWEPDDNMGYSGIATEAIYGKQRDHFRRFKLWKISEKDKAITT